MTTKIPLLSNNIPVQNVSSKETMEDTILLMMGYDRITFQTPPDKNFQLFKDHLENLQEFSCTSSHNNFYVYLNWNYNLQSCQSQDSTLIESKSFLNESSTSSNIKKEKYSSFIIKNPKQPVLLSLFNYDKNLKRQFVPLEKFFKSFNKCSNLSYLKFENIVWTISYILWKDIVRKWQSWLNKKVDLEVKLKNTFQSLIDLFKESFFQNFFIIKDSKQFSLDDFCSSMEYNQCNKNKHKTNKGIPQMNRIFPYFNALGIWIDMRNGILIFANSTSKKNTAVCGEPTKVVAGYCINTVRPELLTKKIVLFLNISIIEFFKTQVN